MYALLTGQQGSKLESMHLNESLNLEKACCPSELARGPTLGHASKCQDATDWIEAEDFPFLWFFCLF